MKIIFLVVLLFFWSPISAEVRPEYSGMWYNPDQGGHGLSFEVLDAERSVGFWYRYDESGEPEWWLLKGTNHAANTEFGPEFGPHMKLEAHRFHGMIPGDWDPATNTRVHVTDLVVEFHDCNHITVYDVWAAPAIDMIRLTQIAGMECWDPLPPPGMDALDPPSLEELVGDWMVGTRAFVFPTTITPEGSFEYGWHDTWAGPIGCSWGGQFGFQLDGVPSFHVVKTVEDAGISDHCYGGLYSIDRGGYFKNFELCVEQSYSGGVGCQEWEEILIFDQCDGVKCEAGDELIFIRDPSLSY